MATNERTRRVAPSKSNSKSKSNVEEPVYSFEEYDSDLEEERQGIEESAIEHIVRVYRRWRERNVEFGLSVNKFADLWQKAYPYRSAGAIRKDIQKMKKVHEFYKSSFDLDTIEDTTHFDQLYDDAVRLSGSSTGKKKKSTRESMRSLLKNKSKTELRILMEEAQALLDA